MFIKRLFDISLSLLLLIVLIPFFLLIVLSIKMKMGGAVLFTQNRPGLNGKIFKMYKFRTMLDKSLVLDSDEKRITKLGSFLRNTSLDEIPELWNVLIGEMSFVGPRPLLVEYLPLYSNEQRKRHNVLPGITGWAQVNGRNAISWEDKFKFDLWYVDNRTLWLDIQILLMTIKKVYCRDGINADGEATMAPFKGENN